MIPKTDRWEPPRLPNRCPECRRPYTLRRMVFDYGTPIETRKLECTSCEFVCITPSLASEEDVDRMMPMFPVSDIAFLDEFKRRVSHE